MSVIFLLCVDSDSGFKVFSNWEWLLKVKNFLMWRENVLWSISSFNFCLSFSFLIFLSMDDSLNFNFCSTFLIAFFDSYCKFSPIERNLLFFRLSISSSLLFYEV